MPEVVINFLDVGQGDGTFIACPNGQKILIDFGTVKNGAIAVPDAMTFLKTQFTTSKTLDLLVVTHADRDHYNRIEDLVDTLGLTVNLIWISGKINDYKNGDFNKFLTKRKNVVKEMVKNAKADKSLTQPTKSFGGVNLYVLSASLNYPNYSDPNPYSIVIMLEYGGVRCVLPGDATFDTEDAIIEHFGKTKLASYALKMGHHGSAVTSSGDDWVAAIKPRALFVSADNRFNHPSCAVINSFTNVETLQWKNPHKWYCYDVDRAGYWTVTSGRAVCTSMLDQNQGVQYALWISNLGATAIGSTAY